MQHVKLGFLGAGNMGGAILQGVFASGGLPPALLRACDTNAAALEQLRDTLGIETTSDASELLGWADVVLLALKPQVIPTVLPTLKAAWRPGTLVISVAAGLTTSALQALLPDGLRVVRTMPNTPALVRAGVTAIARGATATSDDVTLTRDLFASVGTSVILDEAHLDAVTGLSGSGPAYVLLFIEALADGGVKMGLPRATALELARQTVLGTAQLLCSTGEHPAKLKDAVTSPGGTTIAGLMALEEGALRYTVMNAVQCATLRSIELQQPTKK